MKNGTFWSPAGNHSCDPVILVQRSANKAMNAVENFDTQKFASPQFKLFQITE